MRALRKALLYAKADGEGERVATQGSLCCGVTFQECGAPSCAANYDGRGGADLAVTSGPNTASHERCIRAYGDGEPLEMIHYTRILE